MKQSESATKPTFVDAVSFDKLRKGMIVLGTIRDAFPDYVVVQLPNKVTGLIQKYKSTSMSLNEVVTLGTILPMVVIDVTSETISTKVGILEEKKIVHLSISPSEVNHNITFGKLHVNMQISGMITSIEDDGCFVDLHVDGFGNNKSFLNFDNIEGKFKLDSNKNYPLQATEMINGFMINVGRIFYFTVSSIPLKTKKKTSKIIQLSLSTNMNEIPVQEKIIITDTNLFKFQNITTSDTLNKSMIDSTIQIVEHSVMTSSQVKKLLMRDSCNLIEELQCDVISFLQRDVIAYHEENNIIIQLKIDNNSDHNDDSIIHFVIKGPKKHLTSIVDFVEEQINLFEKLMIIMVVENHVLSTIFGWWQSTFFTGFFDSEKISDDRTEVSLFVGKEKNRDELVKQMEEIILENLVLEIHLDNKIMTVLFGYHGDSFRKKCKDVKVAVYKSINNVVCFQGSLKNVSYVFYTFCCWS